MVNDDHGDLVLALEFAQEAQERGHLGGVVFVDAMEADEGIEHEQAGAALAHGTLQTLAVGGQIQSEGWSGDDVNLKGREVDTGGGAAAALLRVSRSGIHRDVRPEPDHQRHSLALV